MHQYSFSYPEKIERAYKLKLAVFSKVNYIKANINYQQHIVNYAKLN